MNLFALEWNLKSKVKRALTRLTIPPEVATLHVHESDEIEFSTSNGDVIIRKVKS